MPKPPNDAKATKRCQSHQTMPKPPNDAKALELVAQLETTGLTGTANAAMNNMVAQAE
jgi:hypothetical protein